MKTMNIIMMAIIVFLLGAVAMENKINDETEEKYFLLEQQYNELENNYNNLQQQYDELTNDYYEEQQMNNTLLEEQTKLQDRIEVLEDEVTELEEQQLEIKIQQYENPKQETILVNGLNDSDGDGDYNNDGEYGDPDSVYIDENGNIIYNPHGQYRPDNNNQKTTGSGDYHIARGNSYYHNSASCKFLEGADTERVGLNEAQARGKHMCNCVKYGY